MTSPDLSARLSAALIDRYAIERELGRGGMATVYLAADLRHGRKVALKVLRPELASALGPERFQREIRLAARLQHPHIVTVHDSGEIDSASGAPLLWYAMPFIEGETLRERLDRVGQLPVDEALRIAREAADALDYAHRQGVIHRDIKPENILLAENHALVADFGIGKALGSAGHQHLTETGFSLGTPAYMSPEQASADRHIDAHTDIYSLGVVLYEMLAGEPPFVATTAQAVIAKRFTGEVPSLRASRPLIQASVDAAVRRALSLLPADRHASMADFGAALGSAGAEAVTPSGTRRPTHVAIAVTILLAIAAGLAYLIGRPDGAERASTTGDVRRLAVLPFENLGDSADAYFADGVTDAVRGKLTALPGLRVTASNSSNQYRGSAKTPQQIGEELGVDYLLEGRVRWAKGAEGASRVQLRPELIEVATGTARWQAPFDAALTDIFETQAEIAGRVAAALGVELGTRQQELIAERPTDNLHAYDAFLRGEAESEGLDTQAPPSLRRASQHYAQAVALDPDFALAWSQLARTLAFLYYVSSPRPADAEGARQAVDRTEALAPGRVEALLARGDFETYVRRDPLRALEAFEAGLRIAPSHPALLTNAARAERFLGRWDPALDHVERAHALDPRSGRTAWVLAFSYLTARRIPDARRAVDRGLALAPTNLDLIQTSAMTYLAEGDLEAARRVARTVVDGVDPVAMVTYFALYWDLYWLLDDAQQREVLQLPLSAYDGNAAARSLVHAQLLYYRGEPARAAIFADSARRHFESQIDSAPRDAQLRSLRGLALAYAGRKAEAILDGERALALKPDPEQEPYFRHQLVRIYLIAGEKEKAIDQLEQLLAMPYFVTPAWLRVDPNFAGLRGNARFDRLIAADPVGAR